jgi:D-glycero-D-manno-heptose 1,7-bisphosphate phosphatase
MNHENPKLFITDQNVWSQVITDKHSTFGRPALFIDRDGVIVEEVNYLHRPEDVSLIPGAIEVIRRANTLNIPIIIVTNQAGIGRRYYDWKHFVAVQEKILELLNKAEANIDAVFACPHHPDARGPYFHKNHPWRKPNSGMLVVAELLMKITLQESWIIGDRSSDIRAGFNAGCAGGIHLRTGHGIRDMEQSASLAMNTQNFQIKSLPSIAEVLTELPLFKQYLN